MDIDKVRALTDPELLAELVSQRRNLYDLRFQLATRQLTDHSQLTQTRRSIARVLTVMTERDLDESKLPTPVAPTPTRRTTRAKTETKTTARTTARTAAKSTTKTTAKAAVATEQGDEE
jgi:large subunit ribosomal protein L29